MLTLKLPDTAAMRSLLRGLVGGVAVKKQKQIAEDRYSFRAVPVRLAQGE